MSEALVQLAERTPRQKERYARDPTYGKPPSWSRLYATHFPLDTDGASRHVKIIAQDILRDPKSPVRRMLIDAGYEPDHWAQSMEIAVQALWKARADLRRESPNEEPTP